MMRKLSWSQEGAQTPAVVVTPRQGPRHMLHMDDNIAETIDELLCRGNNRLSLTDRISLRNELTELNSDLRSKSAKSTQRRPHSEPRAFLATPVQPRMAPASAKSKLPPLDRRPPLPVASSVHKSPLEASVSPRNLSAPAFRGRQYEESELNSARLIRSARASTRPLIMRQPTLCDLKMHDLQASTSIGETLRWARVQAMMRRVSRETMGRA